MKVCTILSFVLSSINALAVSRRQLVRDGVLLTTGSVIAIPRSVEAARGAAELDMEFYLRDLFGGNKKEGNVEPTQGPKLPPPRRITDPLRNLLINNDCNVDCLTSLALVEVAFLASPPGPPEDPRRIEIDIERSIKDYRQKSKKSFYSRAPWKVEDVADQYYFDLTSYAVWRTAADLLPNYRERDVFVRKLGQFIYSNALEYKLLTGPNATKSLVSSIDKTIEILELFQSNGFCSAYRIGESVRREEDQRPIFDELDDAAIRNGSSVNCLVSVFDPATLGASLQITGEQSRFIPDFVGTTLAAMWEKEGFQSSWETYFVDPEYRPNPKGM